MWIVSVTPLKKHVLDLEKDQRRAAKVISAVGQEQPSRLGLSILEKMSKDECERDNRE